MEEDIEKIKKIFEITRVIAVIGISTDQDKSACTVPRYLQEVGYRIIPVNPNAAGERILDEIVYASLSDVMEEVDMVQIFRPSEEVPPFVDQAIEKGAKFIWMQVGIRHEEAAARAESKGVLVVMDLCSRVCHRFLVNSGLLSPIQDLTS